MGKKKRVCMKENEKVKLTHRNGGNSSKGVGQDADQVGNGRQDSREKGRTDRESIEVE